MKSSKHLQPQRHNPSNSQIHNLLSPIKMNPLIQSLSVAGLSAASYAQLTINPQLFTHLSVSTGQLHHTRVGRTDGHSATLERELSETGTKEKLHRVKQEDLEKEEASRIHKSGQRTVKFHEDPYLRSEEVEERQHFRDIERVVVGRKSTKKHKSKWGRQTVQKGCWTKWGNVPETWRL